MFALIDWVKIIKQIDDDNIDWTKNRRRKWAWWELKRFLIFVFAWNKV